MTFWYVVASDPPAIGALASALGAVLGTVMTGIVDALSGVRGKKLHTAWYLIGLPLGLLLMIVLIGQGVVRDPGGQPTPTPSAYLSQAGAS